MGDMPIEIDFPCLVEREEALLKVQNFLDMLTVKERGILRVVGGFGTGRTRFLSEIAKRAVECGFELGFINAEEKAKVQAAAASDISDIWNQEKNFSKHGSNYSVNGIVLIIDDAVRISDEDLIFVYNFLKCKIPVKLGLVYSIEPDTVFSLDYYDIELCDTVCINPLSPKGVQMWIKNVLDWDRAPDFFLKWLYRETGGLPKLLQENISFLVNNDFLVLSSNNWTISGSFDHLQAAGINKEAENLYKEAIENFGKEKFEKHLKLSFGMGQIWDTWKDWNESLARLMEIVKKQEAVPKLENVKLYIWFTGLVNMKGDYEKAKAVLDEGLELFRKIAAKEGEAEVFYLEALAVSTQGDLKKVSALLMESLELYRSMNDRYGIARVLRFLGTVCYYRGEYCKAEMLLAESLEMYRELKDSTGESRAIVGLGMVARAKGNLPLALELFYRYIESSCQHNDNENISVALANIADIFIRQEDCSHAERVYEKSLKLLLDRGYTPITARVFKELAQLARYEGDYERAAKLYGESLELFESSGDKTEIMWLYLCMAEMEFARQDYSKAKEMYIQGLKVFKESNRTNLLYALAVFEALADLSHFQEEVSRAAKLLGAADKLSEISGRFRANNDFAQSLIRHGKIREKIDREAFETAWCEGNIMNFEEALNYAIGESDDKINSDMAEKLINYIKENYSKDISLTDIAEYFNMSPCYLSTMFKHYTGENFKDYLNCYRVKKAKEYLQKGNMKTATVAKLVGCNSINTFIRIFKKYEGVPPGQFGTKNKN